jgi:D-alanyl-D-alanine carboxypeptidase
MLSSLISLYITSIMPPPIITVNQLTPKYFDFTNVVEGRAQAPIKDQRYISPIIDATSSIAVDLNSGEILYEKNPHKKMQIASITKLMTVLVVLEENKLNEVVTVSSNAASTEGSTMYLRTGEQIAVENLLYGAMIPSANDAAIALAEHNAGTVEAFVEKMNKKAKSLGLLNTHFSNPVGLDNSENYSTSYDLAKLGGYIYQNQFVRHSAKLREIEVKSITGDYVHKLESTNDLLDSYLNIKGLKTGHTEGAGLCLVGIAENNTGNEILTIVLNSPARFTETKILTDWVLKAYKW